ncbi:hypothetical protein J2X20_000207 [Pelomonas saccharophila]|uniref:Uncharacterized protein n=1 Tax=Roseateles saccharophilus TaxID=304 RepID=A0ABU1YFI3_ROSSA|nr:hypothetical protein [Roseateles saccharophilus]MDR7267578.1 hypothetical protein [Roseateles saccharophilus]
MAASGLVIAPPAALALGVALLAWAWWGQPPAAEAPLRPPAVVTPAVAPEPIQRATPAPVPHAASPASALSLTGLLSAPEASLRTSVLAALSQPAQGGRLHARALARRCADLAGLQASATPDVNDARHQRAIARQAALSAGCSQFANGEWLALVNIAPDEAGAGDPLLAIQQSDLDDGALLKAVMAHPDALLLDELGERLLLRRIAGEPHLFFDGQRFDDEADRATAQAALRLLPCHFGLACDERDPEVWLACLRGDGCAASRAEQAPPEAQALVTRMAAALRAGELQRFLP